MGARGASLREEASPEKTGAAGTAPSLHLPVCQAWRPVGHRQAHAAFGLSPVPERQETMLSSSPFTTFYLNGVLFFCMS